MSTQIVIDRKWQKQVLAAVGTYARAFVAAALALYIAGNHDWKSLVAAGGSAVLPVVLRALNPNDSAYGIASPVYTGGTNDEPQ